LLRVGCATPLMVVSPLSNNDGGWNQI
jgi:hypothetical protein